MEKIIQEAIKLAEFNIQVFKNTPWESDNISKYYEVAFRETLKQHGYFR